MYSKKRTTLKNSDIDLEAFVESGDLYNSKFLYLLRMLPSEGNYDIVLDSYRIDIIAKSIYNNSSMSEILLIYNGLNISELKPGVTVKAPYIKHVNYLISRLNAIKNPREFLKSLKEL